MDAINVAPGGSGATEVLPNVDKIGGYRLDAVDEYLYFNGSVCNNWDGINDLRVTIIWELNAASSSDNDSVFLDLACWYKGSDEDTTKYQSLSEGVLVENETQYTMHSTEFTIDYDLADNVVQMGDIFAFRINLNTGSSDVDDVVINFGHFSYKTRKPQPTTY